MWSVHFRRLAFLLVLATTATLGAAGAQSVASYAPYSVSCPSDNLIRDAHTAQGLNPDEVSYVRSRQAIAKDALKGWLKSLDDKVYDGDIARDMPTIALSLSGGNFRAALFNAAALEAFDSRNISSVSKGLGGLLQSSTYMSALSGGSYVLASLVFNEFAPGHDLVFGNNATSGWQLEQSLFAPGPQGRDAQTFITHLVEDLAAKRFGANFTVTFCDLWGRALAYHFLPGTTPDSFASNTTAGDHAASLTFSSATNLTSWKKHELPFPLVVINVNSPNVHGTPFGGNGSVSLETVVYELSPLDFGSYEPQLSSFVPLPYLGSTLAAGKPSHCVNGFDNAGLVIGTSSCDFNPLNVTNSPDWTSPQALGGLVAAVNQTFGALQPHQEMDVTSVPNPFYGLKRGTYQDAGETALALFDGSLDDQNDPLFPLLVKGRKVDVIVTLDSSGETSDFKPNGQSLLATKTKVKMLPRGFMHFPRPFPNSTEEFVSLGLNTRPVFFGCDGASHPSDQFPLLVWIPNSDPGNVTNFATSTLQLSSANQSVIFDRSYALASRGYVSGAALDASLAQADAQWGTCVACAAVERARARRGHKRTAACEACFARYCFTGGAMSATSGGPSTSAQPASTGVVAGNLAANVETNGDGTADLSTLERNSYIIMGLLGGAVVLLVGVAVMLVQSRRATRGYAPIRERMEERSVLHSGRGGEYD